MNDRGYNDHPVAELTDAELLEQALQSAYDSGYYAAKPGDMLYLRLGQEAIARRDECFTELARRLEAAEALAEAAEPFAETSGLRQGINSVWQMNPRSVEEYNRLRDALRPFQKEVTDA